MAGAQINLSIDSDLKNDVDQLFASIGLTTTEAIRMFLRQASKKRRLPLSIDEQDDLRRYSERPVYELTEEGYRNLAKAMNNPEHFEKVLENHMNEYHKFMKENNIKVK